MGCLKRRKLYIADTYLVEGDDPTSNYILSEDDPTIIGATAVLIYRSLMDAVHCVSYKNLPFRGMLV